MSKIDHENRNKLDRVWKRGSFNRGSDPRPGDEYLSSRDERLILGRLSLAAKGDRDTFSNLIAELWPKLRLAAQEIVFEMWRSQEIGGVLSRGNHASGDEWVRLEFSVEKFKSEEYRTKIILVLKTAILFQVRVLDPIAQALGTQRTKQ